MRPGRKFTRHRLSEYQVLMLAKLDAMQSVYVGHTYESLIRKGLIAPSGHVSGGKLGRATLTPEGAEALRDARLAGWRP